MQSRFNRQSAMLVLTALSALIGMGASADVEIRQADLPFTADIPGETYVFAEDMTVSGTGILINSDNVTIDGNGRTLTYAVSEAGNGIVIGGPAGTPTGGILIENCVLVHGGYDPVNPENVHAIFRNGSFEDLEIRNNDITIVAGGNGANGGLASGIELTNYIASPTGVDVHDNTVRVTTTSAGRGISIGRQSLDATFQGRIRHNTIVMASGSKGRGRPRAISLIGVNGGPTEIHHNHITLGPVSIDDGEQEAISLVLSNDVQLYLNEIIIDSDKGRGILVDLESSRAFVFRNTVTINGEPPPGVVETSAGIRVRFGSNDTVIAENVIDASGADLGVGIRIGGSEGARENPTGTKLSGNRVTATFRALEITEDGHLVSHDNTYENVAGADAVRMQDIGSELLDDILMARDTVTGDFTLQGGPMENITFCDVALTGAINRDEAQHSIAITSAPCGDDGELSPVVPPQIIQTTLCDPDDCTPTDGT